MNLFVLGKKCALRHKSYPGSQKKEKQKLGWGKMCPFSELVAMKMSCGCNLTFAWLVLHLVGSCINLGACSHLHEGSLGDDTALSL